VLTVQLSHVRTFAPTHFYIILYANRPVQDGQSDPAPTLGNPSIPIIKNRLAASGSSTPLDR